MINRNDITQYVRDDTQYAQRRPYPIDPFIIAASAESSGAAPFFTVPDDIPLFQITRLVVGNLDSSPHVFSLSYVPSGGGIATVQRELTDYSVQANSSIDITNIIRGMYEAGTVIRAWTSGTTSQLVIRGFGDAIT